MNAPHSSLKENVTNKPELELRTPKAKVSRFAISFLMLVPQALLWEDTFRFMCLIQNLVIVFKKLSHRFIL